MAVSLGSYLGRLSQYESRNNPNAVSPTGARGLFQFTRGTGRGYGLVGNGFDLRSDPEASTRAVTQLTNDNARALQRAGVPVTEQSLYIAHNIGATDAARLYNNPDSLATSAVRTPNSILVNNGRGLTSQEFIDLHSSRGRFGTDSVNLGDASSAPASSQSAFSPPSTAGSLSSGVETRAGSEITSFRNGPGNSAEVTLGFPGDEPSSGSGMGSGAQQTTGFDSTGGFTGANVAGGSQAGAFGLGGITSGGQAVGSGAGSPYSLDGATLDNSVSADSVAGSGDNIVGMGAMGPVMANPAVVGAINMQGKAASEAIKKGDEGIKKGVETAGQTIGQAISTQSQSWLDWAKESFVRLAFIVTGLVLFGAALYYFAKPQIDNAVAGAAKSVAKFA